MGYYSICRTAFNSNVINKTILQVHVKMHENVHTVSQKN